MTRIALLIAACLAALASAVTVAAADFPPSIDEFNDFPVGAHTVDICWSGENTDTADSWTVQRAKGTQPPPSDAAPVATLQRGKGTVCFKATGLVTDAPYTFRVVGHNEAGDSAPGIHTAAAREDGNYVLTPGSRTVLPGSTEFSEPALAFSPGHGLHAVFQKVPPGHIHYGLYHSVRGKGGWSAPTLVSPESWAGHHPKIAANARGAVVVAWNNPLKRAAYRLKPAGTSRFGPRRAFPFHMPSDTLEALVLDRRGHIHALINRFGDWPGRGLHYMTNASGRWRDSIIPRSTCDSVGDDACNPPSLLAYDAVTDRVVAVEQHDGIRLGSKRASAAKFGALRTVTPDDHHPDSRAFTATSVTSSGGRITLALCKQERVPGGDENGALYVKSGGRRLGGRLARVNGGSGVGGREFQVIASSPNRLQLAWRRSAADWDASFQGIWTAVRVRNRTTGRWSQRLIEHITASHYDRLASTAVDAASRPLLAYIR